MKYFKSSKSCLSLCLHCHFLRRTVEIHTSHFQNVFKTFFVDKVKKIISEMVSSGNDLTSISTLEERHCHVSFENFRPLSITEVKCLISKSNSTSCNLDPMPTSLVKKSVHKLAPIIQCIINKSFQTGIFPDSLKWMGRNNHL